MLGASGRRSPLNKPSNKRERKGITSPSEARVRKMRENNENKGVDGVAGWLQRGKPYQLFLDGTRVPNTYDGLLRANEK